MQKFDPQIHHRRNIRLAGFDYSQAGLFFITICVQNRSCLFGEILDDLSGNDFENAESGMCENGMRDRAPTRGAPTMVLNDAGKMVEREWLKLPQRFPGIKLHEYIIMPNHFHCIIETVGAPLVGALSRIPENFSQPRMPQNSRSYVHDANPQNIHLGQIIGAFKSFTTNAYIAGVKTNNWPEFEKKLWQRNYWEHIIRTPEAYLNISHYIINNPETWETDSLQPLLTTAA